MYLVRFKRQLECIPLNKYWKCIQNLTKMNFFSIFVTGDQTFVHFLSQLKRWMKKWAVKECSCPSIAKMLGIVKEFQESTICNTIWIFHALTTCLDYITKVLRPATMVTDFLLAGCFDNSVFRLCLSQSICPLVLWNSSWRRQRRTIRHSNSRSVTHWNFW